MGGMTTPGGKGGPSSTMSSPLPTPTLTPTPEPVAKKAKPLVTASSKTRAERLAADKGSNERQATREIQHSDKERKSFFKRFYNLDEELSTHYDLVVNTDVLSPEGAAKVIAHAATNV